MKGSIIVAPLSWGLGHATRCIPIIKLLIKNKYTPVIASDGAALEFLSKEFPTIEYVVLPSYDIQYAKNLKWNLLLQIPKILKAVSEEKRIINQYLQKNTVIGIISDNRFGVRHAQVPSIYITHQLNVFSGIFTIFTTKVHQYFINKFDECWIPDVETEPSFSGKLSQTRTRIKTKRIGVLSRFQKEDLPIDTDVLIVLSGPEPHRTTLELILLEEFKEHPRNVVLVQGVIGEQQITSRKGNITIVNYMLSEQLQNAINGANLVICRSGYSSILDIAKLNKKAFFIPTPGQTEQEYLAKYFKSKELAPYSKQKDFKREMLDVVKEYNGFLGEFKGLESSLFDLFERK
jgi:uncharacterized protein (TIGR00661 family)